MAVSGSAALRQQNFLVDGLVGVGTTNPGDKIEISGSILFGYATPTGDTYLQTANNDGIRIDNDNRQLHILLDNNDITTWVQSTGYVGIGTTSPVNQLHVWGNVTASAFTQLAIGVENYFMDRVGIGTTNPSARLQVHGATAEDYPIAAYSTDANCYFTPNDNSTTSNGYVGFGAIGNDASIRAGNAQMVRVKNTGQVGIGTTVPQKWLHVWQAVSASEFYGDGVNVTGVISASHADTTDLSDSASSAVWSATALSASHADLSDSASSAVWSATALSASHAATTDLADSASSAVWSATALSASHALYADLAPIDPNVVLSSSIWQKVSNDIFLNDTSDIVGIGTTNPSAKLHISGGTVLHSSASSIDSNFKLFESTPEHFWIQGQADDNMDYQKNQRKYRFFVDRKDESFVGVGIGTNSPSASIHIVTEDTVGLIINSSGSTPLGRSAKISFWEGVLSSPGQYRGGVGWNSTNQTIELQAGRKADRGITFWTSNSQSGMSQAMRITSGSDRGLKYVGIGIDTPQVNLHVTGTIVATHNVGIGTTNPTTPLQVQGNAYIVGEVSGTNAVFTSIDRGTTGNSLNLAGGNTTDDGGNINLYGSTNGTYPNGMLIRAGSINGIFMDSLGHVGIGTTDPSSALHVHTGSAATAIARFTSANGHSVVISNSGSGMVALTFDVPGEQLLTNVQGIRVTNNNSTVGSQAGIQFNTVSAQCGILGRRIGSNKTAMDFWTEDSARSVKMTITEDGKVGIGVTNPASADLEISSSGTADIALRSVANPQLVFYSGSSAGSLGGFLRYNISNAKKDMGLYSQFGDVALTNGGTLGGNLGIILDYNGRVGIGTGNVADPNDHISASLHVFSDDEGPDGFPLFKIESDSGSLFQVTDSLTGSLFQVNDLSGVPVMDIDSARLVTIGATKNASYSFYVNGDIGATGDIIAFASSDLRLKENIEIISGSLGRVLSMRGVEFDWKHSPYTPKYAKGHHDVGLIAQEVKEIVPEVTKTRKNGYMGIRYEKLIPVLVEAIKEQQKQIDELKKKVEKLDATCNTTNSGKN